jgi:hypothetical protein
MERKKERQNYEVLTFPIAQGTVNVKVTHNVTKKINMFKKKCTVSCTGQFTQTGAGTTNGHLLGIYDQSGGM